MSKIICPFCEHHIRISDVEAEETVCPECGRRFPIESADGFYSNEKE